jgi:hypothetical protein
VIGYVSGEGAVRHRRAAGIIAHPAARIAGHVS